MTSRILYRLTIRYRIEGIYEPPDVAGLDAGARTEVWEYQTLVSNLGVAREEIGAAPGTLEYAIIDTIEAGGVRDGEIVCKYQLVSSETERAGDYVRRRGGPGR